MPPWLTSLLFAVLVVTIPFMLIIGVMQRLPGALALSHRRWPMPVNYAVIAAITGCVTFFIENAYYSRDINPAALFMEFVISALAFIFGLVLILRQFAGVYPEFIVTTGWTGLSIRKTVYRNITDVQEISRRRGECRLRVITTHGIAVPLTLPSRELPVFFQRLKREL
jgi:hypothetical protein